MAARVQFCRGEAACCESSGAEKRCTVNLRFCRWLVVPTLVVLASCGGKGPDLVLLAEARIGDEHAQNQLGVMYYRGEGVRQDYAEAARWYRKAAEQGNVVSQVNLADLYRDGKGVPQDYAEAARWYRKAAEQGDTHAQVNLADLYRDGKGVPQDYAEAVRWFSRPAEQGYPASQFDLGVLYEKGQGVPQDYAQAATWYRKASEQGSPLAQLNLGSLYAKGQGVPRDDTEAYFWFDLAVVGKLDAANAERATISRDRAASHLTPSDLSRVQERARRLFEDHPAKPQ
jgi:uncharacterized protein